MKTRLICLFLCVVMMLSVVLTSCAERDKETIKDNITTTASESAMTLTMWVVVEEALTSEVASAVSAELNSISKAKFKTQLDVKFLTQDQYQAVLSETITKYESTPVSTETTARTTKGTGEEAAVTDETRVNDYGFVEIVYPPAVENQVDIIYIAGKDMFDTYVGNGWLAPLDSELNGSSKKIKEYVANALLSASKQDGVTYAIPNNNVIGEYTYMLLDKELMEKYNQHGYYNRGLIDGFCNEYVYNFIDQVAMFEQGVTPIAGSYDDCLDMLAHFWTIDPETYDMLEGFSAFGYYYTDLAELSRGSVVMGYQSLFANKDFAEDFLALNRFRMNGYYAEAGDDTTKAAIKFVKGDKNSVQKYTDDYYAVAVKYPTASVEDIYTNMFGVYTRSKSIPRSMEIVTYLNTNQEFRNVLLYGVEDVHYTVVEDDNDQIVIERDKYNRYIMDIDKTGNAFLAYLQPDMSKDIWTTGKEQNRDALVEPLLGFDFAEYAATTGEGPARVTIARKGYNLSYTTGYSKEQFSQNAQLDAWIKACDANGAGLYSFKTSEVSGQNITYNYYFYNTLGNGYDFVVVENPIMESVTDDEGYVTEKQVGASLVGSYTKKTGDALSYELTAVSVLTKKSYQLADFAFTVDGAATAASVTEGTPISLDLLNTKAYTVEIYKDLSKAGIRYNQALLTWFENCGREEVEKTPRTFVLRYADTESVAGKTLYTFVFLRNGLENITDTTVVPTLVNGKLQLSVIYSDAGEKLDLDLDDGEVEPSYVLDYVRVAVNSTVEVGFDLYYQNLSDTADGAKMIPSKTSEEKFTVEDAAADPDFTIWGNLDTELVKYLYQLNQDINAMIAQCTTYEELESLVYDLGLLLGEKGSVTVNQLTDEKVIAYVTEKAGERSLQAYLNSVRENVSNAISTEVKTPEVNDEGDEILYGYEPYVFYASPCTVYYMWLTEYKYLPADESKK